MQRAQRVYCDQDATRAWQLPAVPVFWRGMADQVLLITGLVNISQLGQNQAFLEQV